MSKLELETDNRLLQAIEAISGGDLDCSGDCGNAMCDGGHPENCDDPVMELWREGGRDQEMRDWLDEHYPDWRDDAPLAWGSDEFE